ncbi:MAG: pentapeptide repeat-containing protein [Solirubrobacterales bacterium]
MPAWAARTSPARTSPEPTSVAPELVHTNLSGANLGFSILDYATFMYATLDGSNLFGASMTGAYYGVGGRFRDGPTYCGATAPNNGELLNCDGTHRPGTGCGGARWPCARSLDSSNGRRLAD